MKTWINRNQAMEAISNRIADVTVGTDSRDKRIADWLGNLNLLYGVPFHNLVPNPEMLPPESIRFFYVDPNWIEAVMDGGLSIGRMTSSDAGNDQVLKEALRPMVLDTLSNHRNNLLGAEPISEPTPPVAGFFLRSDLVKGWPGLEVQAYATSGDTSPMKALRLQHLSKEVILALYSSTFEELVLAQPPEGLHFGADDDAGTYTRDLRSLGKKSIDLGVDLGTNVTDFMRTGSTRVVDVSTLVSKLTSGLTTADQMTATDPFTSAEFAVQMLETAHRAIFTIST